MRDSVGEDAAIREGGGCWRRGSAVIREEGRGSSGRQR